MSITLKYEIGTCLKAFKTDVSYSQVHNWGFVFQVEIVNWGGGVIVKSKGWHSLNSA